MSDSAEVIEAVWLTKDFPVCPLGFPLVGLHTDLLMFCSECGERAKKCVSGVGLQTDVNVVSLSLGGLALAGEEMYNRVKKHIESMVAASRFHSDGNIRLQFPEC